MSARRVWIVSLGLVCLGLGACKTHLLAGPDPSDGDVAFGADAAGSRAADAGIAGDPTPNAILPTATVINVMDKSVVHTGFVLGTATAGSAPLQSVDVSLDGGAYAPASGTSAWTFKLPAGANTWKDGSRHVFAVRATDVSGMTGLATTLILHKGVNQDVNGDGYADLAVGDFSGHVFVFYSAGVAGIPSVKDVSATTTLTGTDDSFGVSVVLGDINGDGYADVVVGAKEIALHTGNEQNPNDTTREVGQVYVFHSSGERGVVGTNAVAADTTLSGSRRDNSFGGAVAIGDVNGDGYADLVVGAINETYVFQSAGSAGIASLGDTHANATLAANGTSVATGDVDGDGYGDVVVGGNNHTYVFRSAGASGVPSATTAQAATTLSGTVLTGGGLAGLGASVAVGDVNGDGYGDLVVGDGTGHAYVFHSSGRVGVASAADTQATTTLHGTTAEDGFFGPDVAVGDVNGDGYADVIVGALGSVHQRVYVFHSSGRAGVPSGDGSRAAATFSGTTMNGGFGMSVAARDVNGDGYADVVVGAGAHVFVFHSAGSAGARSADDSAASTTLGGMLGYVLALDESSRDGENGEDQSCAVSSHLGCAAVPSNWSLVLKRS